MGMKIKNRYSHIFLPRIDLSNQNQNY